MSGECEKCSEHCLDCQCKKPNVWFIHLEDNEPRMLTLQIQITDPEKAKWIWDNHKGIDTDNGVSVQAIHEGIIPEELHDESNA